ncbi:tRNA (adenosine(37)-N6)-threonylcarbamoyltransferase complex ATPase subunit type 1 TsaE [Desulfovibrio sp. OttesenSCG-928-O18]|nr:tRNA (adenosine(37)-N6)-threonylcarbamoyltransferase complex ATPase subunit type 1 TsaE [Desulfovibrio sp. OttesenSCG-928-O18]
MDIFLPDLVATARFGQAAAQVAVSFPRLVPVFFYGALGMGKTTLISEIVRALPGGEDAETSSPSFTLCNMYATSPPVAHFDLYRQEDGAADESLLDFLDGERHLVLVEWAERLPEHALPPERLSLAITARDDGRAVCLTAAGANAEAFLAALETAFRSHALTR